MRRGHSPSWPSEGEYSRASWPQPIAHIPHQIENGPLYRPGAILSRLKWPPFSAVTKKPPGRSGSLFSRVERRRSLARSRLGCESPEGGGPAGTTLRASQLGTVRSLATHSQHRVSLATFRLLRPVWLRRGCRSFRTFVRWAVSGDAGLRRTTAPGEVKLRLGLQPKLQIPACRPAPRLPELIGSSSDFVAILSTPWRTAGVFMRCYIHVHKSLMGLARGAGPVSGPKR